MFNQEILEYFGYANAFGPVDLQAGANDGDWVDMRKGDRCLCVLEAAAGTAGDDPVISIEEAKDASGTDAQALTFDRVRHQVGSVDQQTLVKLGSPASSYDTDGIDGAENKLTLAVEIKADDLSDDFTHIRMRVADVGSNAQLGHGFYLIGPLRHPQAVPESIVG